MHPALEGRDIPSRDINAGHAVGDARSEHVHPRSPLETGPAAGLPAMCTTPARIVTTVDTMTASWLVLTCSPNADSRVTSMDTSPATRAGFCLANALTELRNLRKLAIYALT